MKIIFFAIGLIISLVVFIYTSMLRDQRNRDEQTFSKIEKLENNYQSISVLLGRIDERTMNIEKILNGKYNLRVDLPFSSNAANNQHP